jgi:hypothetical protein
MQFHYCFVYRANRNLAGSTGNSPENAQAADVAASLGVFGGFCPIFHKESVRLSLGRPAYEVQLRRMQMV